jgi:undecaprenyl-diphosphatase
VVALVAAFVVVVMGIVYAGDSGGEWVAPVYGVYPPWRYLVLAIDFLGEPIGSTILIVVLVALCLLLGRRRSAVLVLAGAGVTIAVTTLLKPVVDRTIHGGFLSFPSGHTAFATALAIVLGMLLVDWLQLGSAAGTALVLGAALVAGAIMGFTEVVLSAHYVTDTIGGFCTALAVVPPTAWVVDRIASARR